MNSANKPLIIEPINSISIIWGARAEANNELSQKLNDALQFISTLFPEIYSKWYQLGNSLAEALTKNIVISQINLATILENNQDKRFPELGTKISLWNGLVDENKQASFSARLGLYSDNKNLKNNVVLTFAKENTLTINDINTLIDFLYSTFAGSTLKINGQQVDYFNK